MNLAECAHLTVALKEKGRLIRCNPKGLCVQDWQALDINEMENLKLIRLGLQEKS